MNSPTEERARIFVREWWDMAPFEERLVKAIASALQSEREAAPQDDLEGDVKHGNAEYFRAALAHAAAEARRETIKECAKYVENRFHETPLIIARGLRALASPAPQEETRPVRAVSNSEGGR